MSKKMMIILFVCPVWLWAQTEPPLVASGEYEDDFVNISYTVGDIAILTFQNTTYCWTQGSQQPSVGTVSTQQAEGALFEAEIYPNPIEDYFNCQVKIKDNAARFLLSLFDESGRSYPVSPALVTANVIYKIKWPDLPAGTWFLVFSNEKTGAFFTNKIQKN